MPVDDAVTLITRSFDKYMLDRRERTEGLGAGGSRAAGLPPPSNGQNFLQPSQQIQYLLNLLADRRHLTAPELTSVIDYLMERRRQLDSSGDISARSDVARDQDERRSAVPASGRIMDVDERQPVVTRAEPNQQTAAATRRDELPNATSAPNASLTNMINASINLDNPTVKQALDNLISRGPNIFKNISESLAQKSSAAK